MYFDKVWRLSCTDIWGKDCGNSLLLTINFRVRLSIVQGRYFVSFVILAPPKITVIPKSTEVLEGSTAEFECRANGHPVPEIAWTKDGDRLPSQDRHIVLLSGTLRVVYALPSDVGQYECRAINVIGVVLARATLTVKARGQSKQFSIDIKLGINSKRYFT